MPILNMVGGGKKGGNIGEPLNLTVTTSGLDATITWEDNEIGTIPPTTFQKSELVRKIGSAPISPSDGDLVVTETVKDTYKTTGYVDQGLTDGETYYYRVFSYSDLGGISYCDAVSVTPQGGWQPGANTILYYKFGGNLNDSSGNGYNLTNNGTTFTTLASGKQVLSVEQASAGYSGGPNLIGKSLTASFWFADTATRSGYSDWAYFRLLNGNSEIFVAKHAGPGQGNKIYAGVQGQINYNSAPSYDDLDRHYVVVTFDASTKQLKEYIDNSLKTTTPLSGGVSSTTTDIIIGGLGYQGEVHFQIGDLIIEDKVRTAQEVSDYFNLTKGNYGIS